MLGYGGFIRGILRGLGVICTEIVKSTLLTSTAPLPGPLQQPFAGVGYIPQSGTKNLASVLKSRILINEPTISLLN